VADIMNVYLAEHGPRTADGGEWVANMATPVIRWWGGRSLADVRAASCGDFIASRMAEGVTLATARHNLACLRTAIHYWHANYGPLPAVPVVTLPPKPPVRTDYWLSRDDVAARIRAARRSPRTRHIARLILIGVYTGTRPGAICRLRWLPSTTGGWFDLASETLHRRGSGQSESRKRQPPARIHCRLLPHLRRWHRIDTAAGITHVVHYYGRAIVDVNSAWASVAGTAGHTRRDGPHICRHTAATWQMQSGVDVAEAAGYLGMSPETMWDVYGHHHPAFQDRAATANGRRRR
jgi:integrase